MQRAGHLWRLTWSSCIRRIQPERAAGSSRTQAWHPLAGLGKCECAPGRVVDEMKAGQGVALIDPREKPVCCPSGVLGGLYDSPSGHFALSPYLWCPLNLPILPALVAGD